MSQQKAANFQQEFTLEIGGAVWHLRAMSAARRQAMYARVSAAIDRTVTAEVGEQPPGLSESELEDWESHREEVRQRITSGGPDGVLFLSSEANGVVCEDAIRYGVSRVENILKPDGTRGTVYATRSEGLPDWVIEGVDDDTFIRVGERVISINEMGVNEKKSGPQPPST